MYHLPQPEWHTMLAIQMPRVNSRHSQLVLLLLLEDKKDVESVPALTLH